MVLTHEHERCFISGRQYIKLLRMYVTIMISTEHIDYELKIGKQSG